MAQTGYTPILIYSSSTVSQAPAAGSLTNSTLGSELAINITDGKLFYKDNAGAVQVIAWKTTPTTAGGTGLTSYTAGDLLYYASGTAMTKLAIGATGRWLGSSGTAPQWNAPAALTKTDDTNVTLTLGGSASTALLNAASLTLGWTGTLAVSRGGTGTGTAGITAFNNITGYTASGATGTTSTNLVFSTSPSITTPTLVGDATLSTGNLIQGTAAKGINFTANTPAAGMTSQLLNWYEEGTWTPVYKSSGGSFTTMTMDVLAARYTRIGRQVTVTCAIRTDNVDATGASGVVYIDGLPFTAASGNAGTSAVSVSQAFNFNTNNPSGGFVQTNTTFIYLEYRTTANGAATELPVSALTTGALADKNNIVVTATYTV